MTGHFVEVYAQSLRVLEVLYQLVVIISIILLWVHVPPYYLGWQRGSKVQSSHPINLINPYYHISQIEFLTQNPKW